MSVFYTLAGCGVGAALYSGDWRSTRHPEGGERMDAQQVPELYADGVQIGLGPFGAILSFTMQPAGGPGTTHPVRVANMRMSVEHAKVLAMLLKKQLKVFESQLGQEIPLHPQLYTQLGLSRQEDW